MARRGCSIFLVSLFVALAGAGSWIAWRGSDASLPPLARGMGPSFSVGDARFTRRIRARYPIGSSERRLLADLRSQGFTARISPGDLSMADLRRFIGCGDKTWSVRWRARGGKITRVFGVYGADCL